jgi:hypothetical protein
MRRIKKPHLGIQTRIGNERLGEGLTEKAK